MSASCLSHADHQDVPFHASNDPGQPTNSEGLKDGVSKVEDDQEYEVVGSLVTVTMRMEEFFSSDGMKEYGSRKF